MNRSIGDYGKDVVVESLAHGRVCEIGQREPIQELLHRWNDLTGIHHVSRILVVCQRVVYGNLLRCPREEALEKITRALQCRRHLEFIQPLWHGVRFIVIGEEKKQLAPLPVINARDEERTAQCSSNRVEAITTSRLAGQIIEVVVRIERLIPERIPQSTVEILRS